MNPISLRYRIIKEIVRDMGFVPKGEAKVGTRAYAAARMDRTMADWITSPTKADQDIRQGMSPVRARARDLEQNNDYVKAYLRASRRNIVGHSGFVLQMKAKDYNGDLDRYANTLIEARFKEWSKRGTCEITGRYAFRKVQSLLVNTVKRDGEVFVRKIRGKGVNKFGFTLQMIEPDRVDEGLNYVTDNGNVVRLGVETTTYGKPVAYWVKKYTPMFDLYGTTIGGESERIPAEDIYHLYDPERLDQTRAVSQIAQSMPRLRHLGGYEEAALINARASACKMGFFRDPIDGAQPYVGETDDQGNIITETSPGQIEDIGRKEFVGYDPKYPDSQHDAFVKSNLRGISAGLGLAYQSLSQDLSDVNYSSIRAGLVEEREEWKEQQEWFKEVLLLPLFEDWLEMGFLMGIFGSLPYSKFDKFNAPVWIGRRWAWVDPMKDVEANSAAVRAGFKTATSVISESGGDIEDVYQELAEEQKLAEQYGIELDYGGKPEPKEVEPDAGDEDEAGTDVAGEDSSDGEQDDSARPSASEGEGADGRGRFLI